MKPNKPLVMVTGYDATFARIIADAGVDYILVGDSSGMVIAGESTTTQVTMPTMLYHTKAVAKGLEKSVIQKKPLILGDMPIHSYDDPETALKNARAFLDNGADLVKVEGPCGDVVKRLRAEKIRVCGHIGLTPQSILNFKVQGKTESEAARLVEEAKVLEEAGAELLVLELIPAQLAKKITDAILIPTIGIGAGAGCDGQVLVLYDLLGFNPDFNPKFLKKYRTGYEEVKSALENYTSEVRSKQFPESRHTYESI